MTEQDKFEEWYTCNAFNYVENPIGSRDCGLQRKAWQACAEQKDKEYAQAIAELREKLAAQQKPLSDEEIQKIWIEYVNDDSLALTIRLVRAIEAAHGITGEKK